MSAKLDTGQAQPLLASTKRAARILELSGDVSYQKGGGERELKAFKGMSLSQGDRLITGDDGKAVLEIDNDKKLTVGANSVLDLSQLSGTKGEDEQTRLNMWKGEVLTEIGDRLNTRSRFEIKTPTAVMGVRGTWFVVGQQADGTYIAVIEGALYALSNVPAEQGEQFAAFLEENEQLTLDEVADFAAGVQAEPLTLEQLPLVALQDLEQNIDKLPEGLKEQVEQNIGQVIEQKQQQQQQQQQQIQQQIQQIIGNLQGIIPFVPPTPPPTFGGGGGGGETTPLPSNDLSGLDLTPNTGTINNFTFNSTTYSYQGITTGGSPTSLTVTPTATAGTITVNGNVVASGSQSAAIPLVADSALVVIVVTESGKTPKTYTLYIGDHQTNTIVTTKSTHYAVLPHGISMIPADNPITAGTTPITTETTVETFLGNLNQPPGSTWKVFANANNPLAGTPPVDGVANFTNNTAKSNSATLAENDLLFVLGGDGTTLRGYHITVTTPVTTAHHVVAGAACSNPVAGAAGNQITLTVKDSANNQDTTFSGTKTVTVTGYSAAPGGTIGSFKGTTLTGVSTAVTGVEFSNGSVIADLILDKAAAQNIIFSVSGVATPAASPVSITPTHGEAAGLVVAQQPVAAARTGGADALATQPIVHVVDQYGNRVADSSANVGVAKGGVTENWTLGGTTTIAAALGIATFTDLTITASANVTGAVLAFSSNLLSGTASTSFNIAEGPVLSTDTAVSSQGDPVYFNVTVDTVESSSQMTPANNPIVSGAETITTSMQVQTFLGKLNFPTGSSYKVAGSAAITSAGAFSTWNYDSISGKGNTDTLFTDDVLLVRSADGTKLRGYHLTVLTAQQSAINIVASARTAEDASNITVTILNTATGQTNAIAANLEGYKIKIVSDAHIALDSAAKIQMLINTVNTEVAAAALTNASVTCSNPNTNPVILVRPADLSDGSGVTFAFVSKNDIGVTTDITTDPNAIITRGGTDGSTTLSIDVLCNVGGQNGQNQVSYEVAVPVINAVTWVKNLI